MDGVITDSLTQAHLHLEASTRALGKVSFMPQHQYQRLSAQWASRAAPTSLHLYICPGENAAGAGLPQEPGDTLRFLSRATPGRSFCSWENPSRGRAGDRPESPFQQVLFAVWSFPSKTLFVLRWGRNACASV